MPTLATTHVTSHLTVVYLHARKRERAKRVAHSFLRRRWKARGAESVPARAECSPGPSPPPGRARPLFPSRMRAALLCVVSERRDATVICRGHLHEGCIDAHGVHCSWSCLVLPHLEVHGANGCEATHNAGAACEAVRVCSRMGTEKETLFRYLRAPQTKH